MAVEQLFRRLEGAAATRRYCRRRSRLRPGRARSAGRRRPEPTRHLFASIYASKQAGGCGPHSARRSRRAPWDGRTTNVSGPGSRARRTPRRPLAAARERAGRGQRDRRSRRSRRRSSGRRSRRAAMRGLDGEVELGHRDLEVVAHRTRARRRAARRSRVGPRLRRAATVSSTRWFSVTTCRTRRKVSSSSIAAAPRQVVDGHVAQRARRRGPPRRPLARRAALARSRRSRARARPRCR